MATTLATAHRADLDGVVPNSAGSDVVVVGNVAGPGWWCAGMAGTASWWRRPRASSRARRRRRTCTQRADSSALITAVQPAELRAGVAGA